MSTDTHEGTFGDALDDPAFAGLLTELRDLADRPAPPVGPELMTLLTGGLPQAVASLDAARARRRRTASAVVIGMLSTGVLAGGISAAAADELPAPVQRVVARVVNSITPFEIPDRGLQQRPDRAPDEGSAPSDPAEPEDHAVLPREVTPSAPPSTTPDAPATDAASGAPDDESDDESDDRESTERSNEPPGEGAEEETEESREGSGEEAEESREGSDDEAEESREGSGGEAEESREGSGGGSGEDGD